MKKSRVTTIILFLVCLNFYSQSIDYELKIEVISYSKNYENYTLKVINHNDNHFIIIDKLNDELPRLNKKAKKKLLEKLMSENDSINEIGLKSIENLKGYRTDTLKIKNESIINKCNRFVKNWEQTKKQINKNETLIIHGKSINIYLKQEKRKNLEMKLYHPSLYNPKINSFITLIKDYYMNNSPNSIIK